MPTFCERQKLRRQFAKDVDRMLLSLEAVGQKRWRRSSPGLLGYSVDNFAGWLALPECDANLQEILLKYTWHQPFGASLRRMLRTEVVISLFRFRPNC